MSQQFESRRRRNQPAARRSPKLSERYTGFVRSRTLTGSRSQQVSAAIEKRGFLVSPRLKAQNLRRHRSLLIGSVLVAWSLVIGTIFLLDQYIGRPHFRVDEVAIQPQLSESLQLHTQEYLNNRPLERFRFTINQPQLRAYLINNIPEVDDITIENSKGLANSDAQVKLRKPVAKWQLGDTTYYVDATGQAFEKNYFTQPSVTVRDTSGLPPSEQRRLASRQLLNFIGQVVSGVNSIASVPEVGEVIIPPATLKEIDIVLKGQSYRIKLHTDRVVASQVADIESAIGYVSENDITPRYLDLRIAGKAYYR